MAARGRAAQPEWEAYGFEGRARVLLRAQKWVMDNAPRIVDTIVSETGKTYEDAELAEIGYAGNAFGFWAKNGAKYLEDDYVKSSQVLVKGKKLIHRYRPLGLIGVIGPWNYPLTNSFGDCIPALMAGNSVILKPSEVTPLTSMLIAEGMRECGLPENVLQIATGRGETGAALIEHVDMIMFTGSTKTGRKVAEAAARRLIPSSLELGGKDPMIVLSDADLERAANFATYYSMQNAGQTCISIERVYVEEPVYDEFVAKVSEKVRELRVGKPRRPGLGRGRGDHVPAAARHDQGPRRRRRAEGRPRSRGRQPGRRCRSLLRTDRAGRRRPHDEVHDRGDVRPDAADHEGLATPTRRCALPTTRPTASARRSSRRTPSAARRSPGGIEAGAANVNDAMINYTVLELPMGGAKESGLGTRHGAGGIRKYCSQQAIVVTDKLAMKKEIFMYPYKSRTSKLLAGFFKFMYGRGKRD